MVCCCLPNGLSVSSSPQRGPRCNFDSLLNGSDIPQRIYRSSMGCVMVSAIDFSLKGHTVDWHDHLWEMQKYKRKRFEKVHLKERFSEIKQSDWQLLVTWLVYFYSAFWVMIPRVTKCLLLANRNDGFIESASFWEWSDKVGMLQQQQLQIKNVCSNFFSTILGMEIICTHFVVLVE